MDKIKAVPESIVSRFLFTSAEILQEHQDRKPPENLSADSDVQEFLLQGADQGGHRLMKETCRVKSNQKKINQINQNNNNTGIKREYNIKHKNIKNKNTKTVNTRKIKKKKENKKTSEKTLKAETNKTIKTPNKIRNIENITVNRLKINTLTMKFELKVLFVYCCSKVSIWFCV